MLALGTLAPRVALPEPATGATVLDDLAGPALVVTFIVVAYPQDGPDRMAGAALD
jgi:hypothetical protein